MPIGGDQPLSAVFPVSSKPDRGDNNEDDDDNSNNNDNDKQMMMADARGHFWVTEISCWWEAIGLTTPNLYIKKDQVFRWRVIFSSDNDGIKGFDY